MDRDAVRKAAQRDDTHQVRRARRKTSRAVDRVTSRAGGPNLTRSPDELEFAARDSGGATPSYGTDMRSAVVRKAVELAVLDGERGLQRAAAPVQREASPAQESGKSDTGDAFARWYDEMKAQGMGEAEIVEHLSRRIRAARRELLAQGEARTVGRKLR